MRAAHTHHVPHSEYLSRWDRDDRSKEDALAEWELGVCTDCGIHRETWDPDFGGDRRRPVWGPAWEWCWMCALWGEMSKAGPPAEHGYHLTWKRRVYDEEAAHG